MADPYHFSWGEVSGNEQLLFEFDRDGRMYILECTRPLGAANVQWSANVRAIYRAGEELMLVDDPSVSMRMAPYDFPDSERGPLFEDLGGGRIRLLVDTQLPLVH